MRTAVALGSNLGDRLENLRAARRQIVQLAEVEPPIVSSAIYETDPIDCEPEAPKFLNAVVEFDYEGDPTHLLEELLRIEESLGRKRDHAKNVARTIDIDLLYCGDRQIDNECLRLPHPWMHLRRFVLKPLADIQPDLVLPNQTKSIADLLAELEESSDVVRFVDDW
jgi:2-amino-4-hydroxy-6-hydroxymethyldihydropteridine diphosphokinase